MPDVLRACSYILDGFDTDGTEWYQCTTHDSLEISPDAPCGRCPACDTCGRLAGYCDHEPWYDPTCGGCVSGINPQHKHD